MYVLSFRACNLRGQVRSSAPFFSVRWGFEIHMSVGAIAMNSSAIIVAINAQLLRRPRLQRETL